MRTLLKSLGFSIVFTLLASPTYAAVALAIVDFEDVVVDSSFFRSSEIISGGFRFKQTVATEDLIGVVKDPNAGACGGCVNTNPTQYGYIYNDNGSGPYEVVITTTTGNEKFDLLSFELASLYPEVPAVTVKLYIVGVPIDGGPALLEVVDYDNTADNFQLVELGPEWSNLLSIKLSSNEIFPAFDNFTFRFTSPGVIAPPDTGNLEIPTDGGKISGVNIVSGWHCIADKIEVSFDGGERIEAASGTTRGDTASICGEGNIDTGFSLLWAYSLLGEGVHTVKVYADDVEFDSATFTVTLINGEQFVVGASGQWLLPNFPVPGNDIIIEWSEGNQGFNVIDSGDLE